ncbi:hypothetical protein [uncultured Lawsonella sp.]|uniref:hypothetical protein n=1 Tax=uncultured Lawsonella sp. TaxID=1847727 RepID=UPI002600049B|nr:hypothetical protein [uncultured Lawsonella sp.]
MNTMLLAANELEYGISVTAVILSGIVGLFGIAIFIWAIVRVIQLRNVDVAGLPWVAWLLIVLITGNIGQIVFIVLSYYHEKKQKEAAANGLYYDGHKYYAPINPTGDNPVGTPNGAAPFSNPVYPHNPGPSFNNTFPYPGPYFAAPTDGPTGPAHPAEPDDHTKKDGPIEPPTSSDK